MNDLSSKIASIRELLTEIEADKKPSPFILAAETDANTADVSIISDVVDYLQPLLTPYQSAFYWHLLRHSVFNGGSNLIRVSTRGLGNGVVKSARSETVCQSQVKELLSGLETLGAIRKEAAPNRDGTLYRVFLPAEIDASNQLRSVKASTVTAIKVDESEADYYNVKDNRRKIYERDNYVCHYCSSQLTTMTATLDHIVPVVEGGGNDYGNLVTSCLTCNSRKNRRPVGDFLADGGPK